MICGQSLFVDFLCLLNSCQWPLIYRH